MGSSRILGLKTISHILTYSGLLIFSLGAPFSLAMATMGVSIAFSGLLLGSKWKEWKFAHPLIFITLAWFLVYLWDIWNHHLSNPKDLKALWTFVIPLLVAFPISYPWPRRIALIFLYSVLIASILGLVPFFFSLKPPFGHPIGMGVFCFTGGKLSCGGFFAIAFSLYLSLILFWNGKRYSVIFWIGGLSAFLMVIFSLCRSYYVALGLSFPLFILFSKRIYSRNYWVKSLLIGFGFLFLISGISILHPPVKKKIASIFDYHRYSQYPSIQERLHMWEMAWRVFKDHPITGAGFYSWKHLDNYFKAMKDSGKNIFCRCHPHSNIFTALAEGGIVGLLCLFTYFFFLFRNALNIINQTIVGSFGQALAIGLLIATFAVFIGGLFEYNIVDDEIVIPLFVLHSLIRNFKEKTTT